jgi:hypothetical protein
MLRGAGVMFRGAVDDILGDCELLAQSGFRGHVIAEVSTAKAQSDDQRVQMVKSSLDFARYYMAVGRERLQAGVAR